MTGFNVPELFKHFNTINLKVNTLIRVLGCKAPSPKPCKTEACRVNSILDNSYSLYIAKGAALPEDLTECDELDKQLTEFWPDVDMLFHSSPSGSMLRDIARLDIILKSHSLPIDEAEKVRNKITVALTKFMDPGLCSATITEELLSRYI